MYLKQKLNCVLMSCEEKALKPLEGHCIAQVSNDEEKDEDEEMRGSEPCKRLQMDANGVDMSR